MASHDYKISQDERYKVLLNPLCNITKVFDIDIEDLLQNFLDVVKANSQVPISGSQLEINFAEAALMIEGSSEVYGKKVEYLYTLTKQLCQAVHNEKKAVSLNEVKNNDMLTDRQNAEEFQLFDNIEYQGESDNLIADYEKDLRRYNMSLKKIPPPPVFIPLDEDEKDSIKIKTTEQEFIGNLRSFQMNVCDIMAAGCAFSPAIAFKPENEEVPLFVNSTFLSTGMQDHDLYNQPFQSFINPSSFYVNGMDIQDDDNCSIHDYPLSENPAASSSTPTPQVHSEDTAESQKIDGPILRRSEYQAKPLSPKKKKLKNDYDVKPEDVPNPIVPLKESKVPAKWVKSNLLKGKKNSCEFVNDMMNIRKGKSSLEPSNPFVEENFDGSKAFEFLISVVSKHESRASKSALNAEAPPEIESSKPLGCEVPFTDRDSPDDDSGSTAPDFDDGPCASPGLPSIPEDEDTFDNKLKKYVCDYLKGAQKFSISTALSQNVKEWEKKIKPVIRRDNERELFNIHQYGTQIIDKFSNNPNQSLPFSTICKGMKRWEVCRYFMASLMLGNNNNIEISASDTSSGMHEVSLTLLSRKCHQELDAFEHNSGEHE